MLDQVAVWSAVRALELNQGVEPDESASHVGVPTFTVLEQIAAGSELRAPITPSFLIRINS